MPFSASLFFALSTSSWSEVLGARKTFEALARYDDRLTIRDVAKPNGY
jgi:hypothetical protein